MNDVTPEEASNETIDALRNEILQEDSSAEQDGSAAPDAIVALVAQADIPTEVGLALDDLLADEDTLDGAFHNRLVGRVRGEVERRASAPVYLEQVVRAERERSALTVEDLADQIHTTPDTVRAIEAAERGFGTLTEEVVAAWIDSLDLELDSASAALEASLLQPAAAYRGEEARRTKKDLQDFVDAVCRLVARRRLERAEPS